MKYSDFENQKDTILELFTWATKRSEDALKSGNKKGYFEAVRDIYYIKGCFDQIWDDAWRFDRNKTFLECCAFDQLLREIRSCW